MTDAALVKAYPDEETRRKVCGTLKAKLEAGAEAEHARVEDAHVGGSVLDGGAFWLIKDCTLTRAGVTGNGELKTDEAVKSTVQLLDGTPFAWADTDSSFHKPGAEFLTDPKMAAGVVVNPRYDSKRMAAVYDLMLYKQRPKGHTTSEADLARNAEAARFVAAGGTIHNSPGFRSVIAPVSGVAQGMDGTPRAFDGVQLRTTKMDHVAGLAPIASGRGACPVPLCGVGRTEHEAIMTENHSKVDPTRVVFELVTERREKQENENMDEATRKELLAQARTESEALVKKALADAMAPIETKMTEACSKLDSAVKDFGAVRTESEQRKKDEHARAEAEIGTLARKVGELKHGKDATKIEAEVERLKKMGVSRPVLEELITTLGAPGITDPTLIMGRVVHQEGPYAKLGDGSWTVQDWTKVPPTNNPARGFGARPVTKGAA